MRKKILFIEKKTKEGKEVSLTTKRKLKLEIKSDYINCKSTV